jgi:hypothetical protein
MKYSQLRQIIKEEISKVLNEFEDLSVKNNYLDKNFYDPTTGEYSEDVVVDSDKIFQDLMKTKSYFKTKLPLYQDGKPLNDFQIDSLIDAFAANERDIMASDPVGPGDELKWISKWKNVDIDDLADYFVSFVDGISENWEEWEFYDVKKQKYSGDYPSGDKFKQF